MSATHVPAAPATATVPATDEPRPSSAPTVSAIPVATPLPTADVLPELLSAEEARQATAADLLTAKPPLRDDWRLAIAYRGAGEVQSTPGPEEQFTSGATKTFYVRNLDTNTIGQIKAELLSIGDNAYFWFDTGPGSADVDNESLVEVTGAFDRIYEALFEFFGTAEPPGGRVHIVHASPLALCSAAESCRLAGYYSGQDHLPAWVNPYSNELSMFVMNTQQFGTGNYLDVLAHELRHMLGAEYDAGEEDWFVEGAAMFAEELVGFTQVPQSRGTLFLENPDQQLNSWTDENTTPYYGQGYLIHRYLYDRLGEEQYRRFSMDPAPGLAAVDAVTADDEMPVTGQELWLDWLATMALHSETDVPDQYRWSGPQLGPVATEAVNNLPARIETTVSQYAADYYELPSSGRVTVVFSGEPTVPLLSEAPNGERMWYAQRANYSNPRLTRMFDLTEVTEATLRYRVFVDIERGYDFAYVAVSRDDGQTWKPLVASRMQGLEPADDPSGTALARRFYTGRMGHWINDRIDLTPFAGQQILLRFEYVTDPILTFGGFAIDDIAIPELGFFDNAETADGGWTAEGFTRATETLPQQWHLQLISFNGDGSPAVERWELPEDGEFELRFEAAAGDRRPILIVAATSPDTLQPAKYTMKVINSED